MKIHSKLINLFLLSIMVILQAGCGRREVAMEEKEDVISDKYTVEYISLEEGIRLPKLLRGSVYYAKDNNSYVSAIYCMEADSGEIVKHTVSMENRMFHLSDFTVDTDGNFYYAFNIKPEDENISQWERYIMKRNSEGKEDYFEKIPDSIESSVPLIQMQVDEQGRISFRQGIYQFDENGKYLGEREYEFNSEEAYELYLQKASLEKFGIDSSEITEIAFLEDGRIEVLAQDRGTGFYGLYVLTPSELSVYDGKEELVLGVLQDNDLIRSLVVDFNKSRQDVYITIREYQPTGGSRTSDEALSALAGEFLAGKGPDLIALSPGENHAMLARQGILENLQPYVDQSTIICQEDFLSNVWELGRQDGGLYAIPLRFSFQTLVGKEALLGEQDGWTVEELAAFAGAHPESLLVDPSSKSLIFSLCCTFQAEAFVDREAAECHFDLPGFQEILEFSDTFASDEEPDSVSDIWKYQEDRALLMEADIYDVDSYLAVCQAYGMEPLNFTGYPTWDGLFQCNEMYGISSRSEHKQKAWEFVEYYVQWDAENTRIAGFPANVGQLEQMLSEKTESGELEPQAAEKLRELIGRIAENSVTEITWGDEADILYEEVMLYFNGQNSMEEAIRVIENRVSLYLKEEQ